jgi:hypothetical protein
MKLKQQIMADSWDYEFPISNIQANHIVDLADDYAIGFSEWLRKTFESQKCEHLIGKSEKQLLEIYKQEKGL